MFWLIAFFPLASRWLLLIAQRVEDKDYKVKLEIFEGPLDLLLYLIKKDEIDIYDVSIERITKQYLDYINTFKMLNVELASEFIVMAANLMYIKSRELLPQTQQPPDEDADEEDPRWELIRQLVEYKKFKDAAGSLQERELLQEQIYPRIGTRPDFTLETAPGRPEVSVFDLINAVSSILKRFAETAPAQALFEDRWSVSDKIEMIRALMAERGRLKFYELFELAAHRVEVVVTFLALLELIRMKLLRVEQPEAFGDIEISVALPAPPPLPAEEQPPSPAAAEPAAQPTEPAAAAS